MWGTRTDRGDEHVTCIACGGDVERRDAREYDKYGNRWERRGKEFEYLCKPCYRTECHQPRDELEGILCELDGAKLSQDEFLELYNRLVQERYGTSEQ
ncbi:DUF7562 family protein [Haloarchaeobius sp. TZWWS8]|uniref:DUF7562 family protein n=1 Tax=Haloarchaeobius sp. TZWWS8 TaxID=3446121 RepID=UPI003EBA62BE